VTLVIDASVAIKWFIDEPFTEQALALLNDGEPLIAPELILAEVLNAAWKRARRGDIRWLHFHEISAALNTPLLALEPLHSLARRAAEVAEQLDHPLYDCFYLALAEQRDAAFVTADQRLLTRVAPTEWAARTMDLRRS
jgi:predicted nucleic acid-binding protein